MYKTISIQLAEQCGGTWKAVRDGFGWKYVSAKGHVVRRYSEAVLGYDGYSDDEFNTIYIDDENRRLGRNGIIYWSGAKFGDDQPLPAMMGLGDCWTPC